MRQDDSTVRKADEMERTYAPCPTCHQYSHSIGCDALAAAFNHFQTMIAHPVRGTPMGHAFDAETREAAQVLMAATLESSAAEGALRAVPEGMVLVPREPTEAMLKAGAQSHSDMLLMTDDSRHDAGEIWSAMLSALTPTETGEQGK